MKLICKSTQREISHPKQMCIERVWLCESSGYFLGTRFPPHLLVLWGHSEGSRSYRHRIETANWRNWRRYRKLNRTWRTLSTVVQKKGGLLPNTHTLKYSRKVGEKNGRDSIGWPRILLGVCWGFQGKVYKNIFTSTPEEYCTVGGWYCYTINRLIVNRGRGHAEGNWWSDDVRIKKRYLNFISRERSINIKRLLLGESGGRWTNKGTRVWF